MTLTERAFNHAVSTGIAPQNGPVAPVRTRVYIDSTDWRGSEENVSILRTLQDAVYGDRKLAIVYRPAGRDRVDRVVDPLGLVAKRSTWYLVARTAAGLRSYRVSRIEEATLLDAQAECPPDFDLADFWHYSSGQFRDEITRAVDAQRQALLEKEEAERRSAHELEIARQVQARLFPQSLPPMRTLDYAGTCVQARGVGGDYYDFLNLGHGKLGIVLADIAGKGIAAALLMANLQANLRSQCASALDEPEQFLNRVNQLFFENTSDSDYATLFFGEYDDQTRRLRYANCGHLPAFLLRENGGLEVLDSTCTVLGLFREWECAAGECTLAPGDTLAIYTDGVTESFNEAGEEFGERRLLAALRAARTKSPADLLSAVVGEVSAFSPREQHDDITLLVAHCR